MRVSNAAYVEIVSSVTVLTIQTAECMRTYIVTDL